MAANTSHRAGGLLSLTQITVTTDAPIVIGLFKEANISTFLESDRHE
jgi:hypothetical protein